MIGSRSETETVRPPSSRGAKEMLSPRIAEIALVALAVSCFQGSKAMEEFKKSSAGLATNEGIPLHAGTWFEGPRLVIEVAPSNVQGGWLPKQRLILDTGSSTLAFCDGQVREDAEYNVSDMISCNIYGTPDNFSGYFGPFVWGPVKLGNFTMPEASYSIMQHESGMPCSEGLDGIFGIAFWQLDAAFRKEDESEMQINEEGNFTCPEQATSYGPPPLTQLLRSEDFQKFGIYWSGQLGEDQGSLFLGPSAVENEHYMLADPLPAATLGELGWYDIQVEAINVNDQQISNLACDPLNGQPCYLDTGTPVIILPQEAYELVQSQGEGNLTFQLAGPNGSTSLTFDLQTLNQTGAICEGGKGDPLTLGLPIWAFYYTVFDLQEKQVIFVPTYPQPSELLEIENVDARGTNTSGSGAGRRNLRGSVQV